MPFSLPSSSHLNKQLPLTNSNLVVQRPRPPSSVDTSVALTTTSAFFFPVADHDGHGHAHNYTQLLLPTQTATFTQPPQPQPQPPPPPQQQQQQQQQQQEQKPSMPRRAAPEPKPEISVKEDVPVSSIKGIVTRYRLQQAGRDRPRPGRPRILSDRDVKTVLRVLKEKPDISYAELKRDANLTCATKTLVRYLQMEGIKPNKPPPGDSEEEASRMRVLAEPEPADEE
uniref:DNA transposase n=1 Tax=Colletotrichum fructicola (strain Nara gc5) TaxID=1213859 RepID=L2G9S1_COLFN